MAIVTISLTACTDSPTTRPPLALALDPVVLVGTGDIATCGTQRDELTANLLDSIPGTVFTLGDNVYENGTAREFNECYHPSWGRHRARTRPVPGNHDYNTSGASGYFGYFGAAAGDPARGYYSYDAGAWRIIVLNSNIARDAASPQVQWLAAELRAAEQECVAAMWHHPRFTSTNGRTTNNSVRPFWDTLYAYGADLVLTGHDHVYERFAPMRPDGTRDDAYGLRQITIGTGGVSLYSIGTVHPNSVTRNDDTHGVVRLSLSEGAYAWEFVPIAGAPDYDDTGSATCHGRPGGPPANQSPAANPGGPYASSGAVTFNGSGSSDPDGNLPLSHAWSFGDNTTGSGANPAHTYASLGTYTVSLVVTDARGAASAPVTTTVTITAPGATAVLAVAGNIAACTTGGMQRAQATAALIDAIPGTVLTLGDNAFPSGSGADYTNCYHPTWGRHRARTWAALGNHEYASGNANGAFNYFNDRVGPRGLGYYSFDAGAWHVIVLNDNAPFVAYAAGSAQDQWLVEDLAANARPCTVAVWHTPLFLSSNSAGYTRNLSRKTLWDRLHAAGVDVVLNGQQHHYERMAPMRPDGTRDVAGGIRQFNVGTGGESVAMPTVAIHPNSEVRSIAYGVLKLTLRSAGYDWAFAAVAGSSFTDTGSGSCH